MNLSALTFRSLGELSTSPAPHRRRTQAELRQARGQRCGATKSNRADAVMPASEPRGCLAEARIPGGEARLLYRWRPPQPFAMDGFPWGARRPRS